MSREIGVMMAREEVDALKVAGIEPLRVLVVLGISDRANTLKDRANAAFLSFCVGTLACLKLLSPDKLEQVR